MPNTMLYANDSGQYKPLHSASNKPVFAMPQEYLFFELKHYNSEEHPTSGFFGADLYDMDSDLLPYPNSTPNSPYWVKLASQPFSSSYSTFQDINITRTKVNLKSGRYDGLPACNAGVFRYEIVIWSFRYLDAEDNITQQIGHSENIEIRAYIGDFQGNHGIEVSNTKLVLSVPVFINKFDGEESTWLNIPPFPTPQCHVATVYWNSETRSLSIS